MQILIEDQRAVEVQSYTGTDEDGEEHTLIAATGALDLIAAWRSLAPARRGVRSGRDDSDPEASTIYVAEAQRGGGLVMVDIEPHWDGAFTCNAYRLADFTNAFDMKVVE